MSSTNSIPPNNRVRFIALCAITALCLVGGLTWHFCSAPPESPARNLNGQTSVDTFDHNSTRVDRPSSFSEAGTNSNAQQSTLDPVAGSRFDQAFHAFWDSMKSYYTQKVDRTSFVAASDALRNSVSGQDHHEVLASLIRTLETVINGVEPERPAWINYAARASVYALQVLGNEFFDLLLCSRIEGFRLDAFDDELRQRITHCLENERALGGLPWSRLGVMDYHVFSNLLPEYTKVMPNLDIRVFPQFLTLVTKELESLTASYFLDPILCATLHQSPVKDTWKPATELLNKMVNSSVLLLDTRRLVRELLVSLDRGSFQHVIAVIQETSTLGGRNADALTSVINEYFFERGVIASEVLVIVAALAESNADHAASILSLAARPNLDRPEEMRVEFSSLITTLATWKGSSVERTALAIFLHGLVSMDSHNYWTGEIVRGPLAQNAVPNYALLEYSSYLVDIVEGENPGPYARLPIEIAPALITNSGLPMATACKLFEELLVKRPNFPIGAAVNGLFGLWQSYSQNDMVEASTELSSLLNTILERGAEAWETRDSTGAQVPRSSAGWGGRLFLAIASILSKSGNIEISAKARSELESNFATMQTHAPWSSDLPAAQLANSRAYFRRGLTLLENSGFSVQSAIQQWDSAYGKPK